MDDTLTAQLGQTVAHSQKLEAIFLAWWRRAMNGNGDVDLTLAEAAALLGLSVESVRRGIKLGEIHARRDKRGRLRVIPIATMRHDQPGLTDGQASSVVGLWDALKKMHHELESARSERDALQRELQVAQMALESTIRELEAARIQAPQTWPIGSGGIDSLAQRRERARIESKIAAARKLSARRKWPWSTLA